LKNDIHKINYLIKNSKYKELFIKNNNQFININFPNDYEIAKNILDKKE
jgi:molybdopterin-guanine dinucleotide biosynthesis protein A